MSKLNIPLTPREEWLQPSTNNIDNKIDEILKNFLDDVDFRLENPDTAPLKDKDWFDRPLIEAKAAITALVNEARIDEIKQCQRVLRGGNLPVVASIFNSRIKELQPKQEEEG